MWRSSICSLIRFHFSCLYLIVLNSVGKEFLESRIRSKEIRSKPIKVSNWIGWGFLHQSQSVRSYSIRSYSYLPGISASHKGIKEGSIKKPGSFNINFLFRSFIRKLTVGSLRWFWKVDLSFLRIENNKSNDFTSSFCFIPNISSDSLKEVEHLFLDL